jgi:predicted RNA-binding Zn-ribbon protein involved in translation (DUF1610 family)
VEGAEEQLIAVHVCKSCGAATERSAVYAERTISGLINCPVCGYKGDLNLNIQSISKKCPPAKVTEHYLHRQRKHRLRWVGDLPKLSDGRPYGFARPSPSRQSSPSAPF